MKKIIIAALVGSVLLSGCTKPRFETEIKALSDAGYTDVIYKGKALNDCHPKYNYQELFEATTIAGKRITVTVCSNMHRETAIRPL